MASTTISSNYHHLLTSLIKLRRQARERRQYVYSKSLEAQERLTYERKQQLKDALASGKSLPTELRKQARELGKDLAFDEAQTGRFQPTSFLPVYSKREYIM
jgi:U3 small nucleolar ribonucleoprotein protein IMP4